jgi:hypothetical protein
MNCDAPDLHIQRHVQAKRNSTTGGMIDDNSLRIGD